MKCLRAISIQDKSGATTADRITVPCGKCHACLTNKREEWTIRILEEAKSYLKCCFITLTINDNNIVYGATEPTLVKNDIVLFMKRLRKRLNFPIRFYCVGEYGTKTRRPHYHLMIFGLDYSHFHLILKSWVNLETSEPIGLVDYGDLNVRTASYIAKYHVNRTKYPEGSSPPFVLMSKGIGRAYVKKMRNYHKSIDNGFYQHFEFRKALPRYYKNKLYTKFQLQKMGVENRVRAGAYEETNVEKWYREHKNDNYYMIQVQNDDYANNNFSVKSNEKNKL